MAGGIVCLCAGILLLVWSLWSGQESGGVLSAAAVLTAAGSGADHSGGNIHAGCQAMPGNPQSQENGPYRRKHHRPGQGTEAYGSADENESAEERKRLIWELERIRSEQKEKDIRCKNVKEQYEESGKSDRKLRLEERCRALELAAEELQKAARITAESMERRVSRRASEIFSAITDGKYRSLETDRQRGITVWDGERRIPAGRLSRGTVEQIYFCIRMAAAENADGRAPVPVILDDVFAFYDDKRLESVLKWLSGQEKQVIIFTCHSREEKLLRNM